jgi:hypothetical protein
LQDCLDACLATFEPHSERDQAPRFGSSTRTSDTAVQQLYMS